ncbi:hypothetical protein YC2023_075452 [Brassica napus]
MQSSDDITINSTASVKRRGKGPIVVRKTYCSLLDPSLEEHTASSLFKYVDTKLRRTLGKCRKQMWKNQRNDFL